jgi:rod shape-determining protein MreD
VLVVAFALVEGPLSGTVTGFVTGLLADLGSDHELGRTALVYALVGYLSGLLQDDRPRSPLLPLGAVALAGAGAVTTYALEGLLLGDPRISSGSFWPSLGRHGHLLCAPHPARRPRRRGPRPQAGSGPVQEVTHA